MVSSSIALTLLSAAASTHVPTMEKEYRFPDLGFSFEAPRTPAEKDASKDTPDGTMYQRQFTVALDDSGVILTIIDLRHLTNGELDLKSHMNDEVSGYEGTVISSSAVSQDGVEGRELTFTVKGGIWKLREFYAEHIAYEIAAVAPGSQLPPDSERLIQSFHLIPWHWELYTMPAVQPPASEGDLDKIPFSRWERASPKIFASIQACRDEAENNPSSLGGYDGLRFMEAACFDPDTKHLRSIAKIPETYKLPPIDVPGVIGDPFMR